MSLILYYVFQATKVNDSVDPKVINGFGNLISDYVVVFSLAMVQVDVIIKYAAPFLLLMLAFTVWMVVWFWFCGPHLIGKDWFERGLFNWGYATGTFATGFCLLRVVDPNNRSTALSDTAILTPFPWDLYCCRPVRNGLTWAWLWFTVSSGSLLSFS